MVRPTHVALQLVGFLGLNHIVLVRHACPLVQVIAVINVADQGLAFLRMQDGKHVHGALELGLPLGPLQPVLPLILNLASYEGPPDLVVIPGCEGAHVVSLLLLVVQLVFVLQRKQQSRWVTAGTRTHTENLLGKNPEGMDGPLTSLAISLEALADWIGMASSRTSQLILTSSHPSR